MEDIEQSLVEKARVALALAWDDVQKKEHLMCREIPQRISDAISRSINSRSKTYRYVLPTQLLAKVADPRLDCRSIQATSNLTVAFDGGAWPKTLSSHSIVQTIPFWVEPRSLMQIILCVYRRS